MKSRSTFHYYWKAKIFPTDKEISEVQNKRIFSCQKAKARYSSRYGNCIDAFGNRILIFRSFIINSSSHYYNTTYFVYNNLTYLVFHFLLQSDDVSDCDLGFDTSLQLIRKTLEEQGPFDGLMGFSQGAAFAAMLALMGDGLKNQPSQSKFRFF